MSDGASAAPSGAPTVSAPSADAASTAPAQTKEAAKPSWSDDDDKAFFELAKKSPYRAKIKGEERAIDSKQSLQELLNHAQRGIGANKVVELANKEKEAAKAEREEAAKERELIARARKGDFEARRQLGLAPLEEIRKREAEWEQVPPEVRQLYEDRNKAHEELQALRAEKAEREAEIQRRREETEIGAARRVAVDSTHQVMSALGVTKENAERYIPHVAGAIADLQEEGLELGVDMTPELLMERVKARLGAFDESHFSALEPSKAVSYVLPRLMAADDATLDSLLTPEFERRIAKRYARQAVARQRQGSVQPVSQQRQQEERRVEPPKVLSPFRWK